MIRRRQKNKQDFDAAREAREEAERLYLARPIKRKPGRPRKVKNEHVSKSQG